MTPAARDSTFFLTHLLLTGGTRNKLATTEAVAGAHAGENNDVVSEHTIAHASSAAIQGG